MTYRIFGLLAVLILPGVFVYLLGAFLMSTFDVNLWYDGQRFCAVVAYLYILSSVPEAYYKSERKKEKETQPKVNIEEEQGVTAV